MSYESEFVRHALEGLFRDVFGLVISQGALTNMMQRGAVPFSARKDDIVGRLRQAEAVASDETDVRIEGVSGKPNDIR